MARKKITSVSVGTPVLSAGLSWEYADSARDSALSVNGRLLVLPNGKLPRIRQVADPIMLGVHPSSSAPPGMRIPAGELLLERIPAYVPRDVDAELRGHLARSGFVLVVGDSTAGKTRTAYQAIKILPEHMLIAFSLPHSKASVDAGGPRCAWAVG